MKKVRIDFPADKGTAAGTRVYNEDGSEIEDIAALSIPRMDAESIPVVLIEVPVGKFSLWAHPLMSEENMLLAAEYFGYDVSRRSSDGESK